MTYNIDFLINHQDIRQCHFPGDQNRAEDRYETMSTYNKYKYKEEAYDYNYNPNEQGQRVFQSLSPD